MPFSIICYLPYWAAERTPITCGLELMLHKEKELIAVQIVHQVQSTYITIMSANKSDIGLVRLRISLGNLTG